MHWSTPLIVITWYSNATSTTSIPPIQELPTHELSCTPGMGLLPLRRLHPDYPLIMTNSLLLKMTIAIVSFPSKKIFSPYVNLYQAIYSWFSHDKMVISHKSMSTFTKRVPTSAGFSSCLCCLHGLHMCLGFLGAPERGQFIWKKCVENAWNTGFFGSDLLILLASRLVMVGKLSCSIWWCLRMSNVFFNAFFNNRLVKTTPIDLRNHL